MIAFFHKLIGRFPRRPRLRRYRLTPQQNPRVFRREVLAAVIRTLKHDSTSAPNG
jgi:hypothetical protein